MLRLIAVDQAAGSTTSILRSPPGQQPGPVTVQRSEWFNSLSERDQQMVTDVATSAAFMSAFSFCNLLDGTMAFDPEHGSLKLTYIAGDGSETVLNDPSRCEVHAGLRGDGPPP